MANNKWIDTNDDLQAHTDAMINLLQQLNQS